MKFFLLLIRIWMNAAVHLAPKHVGRKGFRLFCNPFSGALKPHQLAFLNTAKKLLIDFEGRQVHGYQWGNGSSKVLLLHGWQSSSFRWKQLVEYMKDEQYTIYALDAPGHGQTGGNFLNLVVYAKLIKTFVEQVNGVQAIVAHSIGGFATVFALHQFPDLVVDKAIIMGAPGEVSDFIVHLKGYTGFSDKVIEAIEQHFIQTLGQPPVYFSARAFGKTVQQPALIVHDEQDLDASVAYAKALYNNMPRAELHLTKGLGHALRSDELMERIQKFIDN